MGFLRTRGVGWLRTRGSLDRGSGFAYAWGPPYGPWQAILLVIVVEDGDVGIPGAVPERLKGTDC